MLDLILFVLAMTLGTESETDYAATAPVSEDVAAVAEEAVTEDAAIETAPEEAMTEEAMTEEAVTEEAVTEEATVEADAPAEAVTEAEAVAVAEEPVEEAAGGGSWNIETATDNSWITNAPEPADTESGGNSLLAGLALSEDETTPASPTFQAEPQIATGKFTTATEVKPILEATKGSWVALRDYEGQDWLYVTHIWAWRCGLHQMRYSINGGPMQVWPLPPCHDVTNAPNAILESDGIPATTFASGEVQSIQVELLLDDLSTAQAQYIRADVLMP